MSETLILLKKKGTAFP